MAKEKPAGSVKLKNAKDELFCWLYAGYHNREIFGNGTRCYVHVFYAQEIEEHQEHIQKLMEKKPPGYSVEVERREKRIKSVENTSRTQASTLLAKPIIRARVDFLLDEYITEKHADRELMYTILQRWDLNAKVAALRELNRLRDRGGHGAMEGRFTFEWDDAPSADGKKKPKPRLKKAELKATSSDVEWQ